MPIVVTGFEPLDVLEGIRRTVEQLEAGQAAVDNAYARAVTREGNRPAQEMLQDVFEVCDRSWRGIGTIPQSGWELSPNYAEFDASQRFAVEDIATQESPDCHSGEVLARPAQAQPMPGLWHGVHPSKPLGATMVSTEGACAAYYRYRRVADSVDWVEICCNAASPPSPLPPATSPCHSATLA